MVSDPLNRSRVLVIDDSGDIHNDFRKTLVGRANVTRLAQEAAALFGAEMTPRTGLDFDVDCAFQGREGLEKVEDSLRHDDPFAVAFVDMRMPPGWDGVETLQHLWRADPDLEVVICTAYSDYSWDEIVTRLGTNDHFIILKKPFDIVEVLQLATALTQKWRFKRQRDQVERQLVEAKDHAEESQRQYQFLADMSPDIIWTADARGNTDYVNSRFVDYAATPATVLLAKGWLAPAHGDDVGSATEQWRHALATGTRLNLEIRLERASDHMYRWHMVRVLPRRNEQGAIVKWHGSCTDIEDQRRAMDELKTARQEAVVASQAKSLFLASMSHEIRTPLNGIVGAIELMCPTSLLPKQQKFLQIAKSSATALSVLIGDILDFSKIEAGRMDLEFITFSLHQLLTDVLELFDARARDKGLALAMHMGNDVPTHVSGDPNRLRQILTNLLSNAIKFTERGTISLEVAACPFPSNHIRFSVADSGIGIPPDALSKLFQSFSQVDSSTTRKYGGTGLGLAISRRLVELMDGQIHVESQRGRGSTFWFTVRLKAVTVSAPVAEAGQAGSTGLRSARILLAEDNEINQMVLSENLQREGHSCDVVGNGQDAVDAAAKTSYDLILMDWQMPGLDGLDAARLIRQYENAHPRDGLQHHVPIIAVTANALQGDRERCLEAGMDDVVTKPVELAVLLRILKKYLAGAAGEQGESPAHAEGLPPQAMSHAVSATDPINVETLLTKANVTPDALLGMFDDFENQLLSLRHALGTHTGDMAGCSKIRGLMASLKGSAGLVSAGRLAGIAARLEFLQVDSDLFREDIAQLQVEMERCMAQLPSLRQRLSDPSVTKAN